MLTRRLVSTSLRYALGVTVALAIAANSAMAGTVHPPVGSFGPTGTGAGTFGEVQGIAVDDSSGDVFVYDAVTQSVYKFTAAGEPAEFSALKTNVIAKVGGLATETEIAVDSSSGPAKGDLYIANAQTVEIYGPDGSNLGELSGAGHPEGEPCGVAVDGSGNVYVGMWSEHVNKYTPSANPVANGDYVSTLYTSDGMCFVAADGSGNLFTNGWNGGPVKKYLPSELNTSGIQGVGTFINFGGANLAANRVNGDVYVDERSRVTQYNAAGESLGATAGISNSYAAGVDGNTGELYVGDASGRVKVFGSPEVVPDVALEEPSELQPTSATLKGSVNPSGVQIASCRYEYGTKVVYEHVAACEQDPGSGTSPVAVTAKVTGLPESTQLRYRLRITTEQGTYTTPESAFTTYGPPTLSLSEPSGITRTAATLNGAIDPHGYDTTYRFEYGTDTSYGTAVPVPDGDIGSGPGSASVSAALTGLEQGVTYHYRLVATNARGDAASEDQTFTAEPAVEILRVWTSGVRTSDAQINAQISPRSLDTTYHFEYGTDTNYGTSVPIPDGTIGAQYGESPVTVSEQLAGLAAGTTYHFRVSATNANGTDNGQDASFTTFAAPQVQGASCPNERVGLSADLPDCRAYELVSPAEKGDANVATDPTFTQSSLTGDAIKYDSLSVFGSAQGVGTRGADYVSRRGESGWTTEDIDPFQAGIPVSIFSPQEYVNFSEDLTKGVYYALSPVVPGYPNNEKAANLYIRTDVLSGPPGDYSLLDVADAQLPPRPPLVTAGDHRVEFAGASTDYSHVLIESLYDLTPDAAGLNTDRPKVYEWSNGSVRLESVLPNGEPAGEALAGAGVGAGLHEIAQDERQWPGHAISADGSRVVFLAPPLVRLNAESGTWGGRLYMRINDSETIQLNASERTEPDPGGPQPARFWGATADDSKVLFTSREMLTDNAESGENLYEYDVNAPQGKHLTLISVDDEPVTRFGEGDGHGVSAVGISPDASYVYFVSENRLIPGAPRSGSESHKQLYVWHNGDIRFIVNRDERNQKGGTSWGEYSTNGVNNTFRITPDGKTIVFVSADTATALRAGYDNRSVTCPSETTFAPLPQCREIYVYNYDSDKLTCASCNPSGSAPVGDASFTSAADAFAGVRDAIRYTNRPISADGRYVFFDTPDALVPQDTNGRIDVYEFDTSTDRVHILTAGTCDCNSFFVDASADGRNAFFTTRQQLVRADFDHNADLYDARVEGGIAAQNEVTPSSCESEDCQGPASGIPAFSLPSSSTFGGAGNLAQSPSANTKKAKPKAKKHAASGKHRKPKKKRSRGSRRAHPRSKAGRVSRAGR